MLTPITPDLATASFLALMRAGEQSAANAFTRIMAKLTPGEFLRAERTLLPLIADERRHDALLALHATVLPTVRVDHDARHFFRRLETREAGVHLARIAALDACACQILSRMIGPATRIHLRPELLGALASIRRDEGRHVRGARDLALALGVDASRIREIGAVVRRSFATLLMPRAQHFEALGIDFRQLIRSIDRER